MNGWQVRIQPEIARLGHSLTIYRKLDGGRVEVYNLATSEISAHSIDAPAQVMFLPDGMREALFEALQSSGIKPKEQSFVEGKVEAQSEHLRDLRKLLKL